VHKTYRGILDKSSHLKSGCILDHGHKPFILEEKSQGTIQLLSLTRG
jgi:hypothetical protein